MFESEEVDEDYFTPMAKTSLASIFKKPKSVEKSENKTLKYTPPVPTLPQSQEDNQRKYQNIFSCVFDAYLWLDNVYTHKGKLGCAVVKHNTADGPGSFHSIVLYDSKRATVSSVMATNTLLVTVKGKDTISYYDGYKKYWYLRGTEDDVNKIIDALKTCNVNIKIFNEDNNSLPQQNQADKDVLTDTSHAVIESDTDSSINRKTKASILNRMASMGQSVLPPRAVSNEPSSDSDTTEYQIHAVKHKPVKTIPKKTVSENISFPTEQTKDNKTFMEVDNQLQLHHSISTPVATTSGHDLNYFFTEQRISNSELRMNMTRITDKVDNMLEKVNHLEKHKNEGNAINTIIFQKLLQEYENKIKTYEELFQKVYKNTDSSSKDDLLTDIMEKNELVTKLNNKINDMEECIKQKNCEISDLNNKIKEINEISNHQSSKQIENELRSKISEQEKVINKNIEKMTKLTTENDEILKSHNNCQIEHKIKSIMNDTFRAIEINFDKSETYSGETIRNIIGTVIKKVTMESLNELSSNIK